MKNILKFNDHDDFLNKTQGSDKLVSMCVQDLDTHVHYGQDSNYINECFSIKILSGSNATIELHYDPDLGSNSVFVATVPISCDSVAGTINHDDAGSNYTQYEGDNGVISITGLNAGDQLWFYQTGDWSVWTETVDETDVQHGAIEFNMTGCTVSLQGNLMSLFATDDADLMTENQTMNANHNYLCYNMFNFGDEARTLKDHNTGSSVENGNSNIIYANNLVLPLKTVPPHGYQGMFRGCHALKTIPHLPATTLNTYCYYAMFRGCESLEDVSWLKLEATVLPTYCYAFMFSHCTSLKYLMPELHGRAYDQSNTTSYAMRSMFLWCTSIKRSPRLDLQYVGRYGCAYMFGYCTNLEELTKFTFSTAAQYAFTGMAIRCSNLTTVQNEITGGFTSQHQFNATFAYCTKLENAPKISFSTLYQYQFYNAFKNCTSLSYIDASSVTNRSATSCTSTWLSGAKNAADCTFVQNSAVDPAWPSGTSGIPSNWTVLTV